MVLSFEFDIFSKGTEKLLGVWGSGGKSRAWWWGTDTYFWFRVYIRGWFTAHAVSVSRYCPDLSLEGHMKTTNLRIVCTSADIRTGHAVNKFGSGDASSIAD